MKQTRLKPLSQAIWQPLPTVGYLCFLFVPSSSKNLKSFLMFEALSVTFMWTHGKTVSTSTISLSEEVNENSYCPTPYPASHKLLLPCAKNSVTAILHISKRNCAQQHLNHDVFTVDLYCRRTGDPKYRNTVVPPVRQLNVSDFLRTDFNKVYCWKVS
jgi:hypothetical protein